MDSLIVDISDVDAAEGDNVILFDSMHSLQKIVVR